MVGLTAAGIRFAWDEHTSAPSVPPQWISWQPPSYSGNAQNWPYALAQPQFEIGLAVDGEDPRGAGHWPQTWHSQTARTVQPAASSTCRFALVAGTVVAIFYGCFKGRVVGTVAG
jgi:hypothetical protein